MPPPVTCAIARTSTAVEQRRHLAARRSAVGTSRLAGRVPSRRRALEHAPHQREAVGVRAARGQADDHVAASTRAPSTSRRAPPRRRRSRRCRVVVGHTRPGSSAVSPPSSAQPACAAAVGHALDELRDRSGSSRPTADVVEEEQRPRARAEHVVDAHRDAVDAGGVQRAGSAVQHELRADAVRAGDQQPVDRASNRPAKPPCAHHARAAGRAHRRGQASDDRLGRVERDAGGGVGSAPLMRRPRAGLEAEAAALAQLVGDLRRVARRVKQARQKLSRRAGRSRPAGRRARGRRASRRR